MKGRLRRRRGISLLVVTGFVAIAMTFTLSLLFQLEESVLSGKREAVVVQSRYFAEAGMARALAGYPQSPTAEAEPFGDGFYWYRVTRSEGGQIEIISRGARYVQHTRLPAVQLTTRWKIVSTSEEPSYKLLTLKEQIVPGLLDSIAK